MGRNRIKKNRITPIHYDLRLFYKKKIIIEASGVSFSGEENGAKIIACYTARTRNRDETLSKSYSRWLKRRRKRKRKKEMSGGGRLSRLKRRWWKASHFGGNLTITGIWNRADETGQLGLPISRGGKNTAGSCRYAKERIVHACPPRLDKCIPLRCPCE